MKLVRLTCQYDAHAPVTCYYNLDQIVGVREDWDGYSEGPMTRICFADEDVVWIRKPVPEVVEMLKLMARNAT